MTAQFGLAGNASSLHAAGRRARRTVEEARETLAEALGARPSEVVFTSGGTEADNLAVKGLYWARRDADPARTRVLASPVEHHAVLDAVNWLGEHEGATVEYLPVDPYGRVPAETLREAIARNPGDVALVTVMWANNEIGTLTPIRELADVAAEFAIPLHSDAVQAFGQTALDFGSSGLAAMTVSGHKIGGPYGIGALLLGRDHTPVPVLHGGGQERQVRSGTLDVPAISCVLRGGPARRRASRGLRPRDRRPARRTGRRRPRGRSPTRSSAATRRTGFPPTRTSAFPAARGTPCSCCWTHRASSAPRAPPARRASPSPAMSCWPRASTRTWPGAPCASRSATPPRRPTSRRSPRRSVRRWRGHGTRASAEGCPVRRPPCPMATPSDGSDNEDIPPRSSNRSTSDRSPR